MQKYVKMFYKIKTKISGQKKFYDIKDFTFQNKVTQIFILFKT